MSSRSLSLYISLSHFLSLYLSLSLALFLSLHCSKQQIMKDRWMNVGHEEEELKPYIEPQPDYKDPKRTGKGMCVRKKVMETWESHEQNSISYIRVYAC